MKLCTGGVPDAAGLMPRDEKIHKCLEFAFSGNSRYSMTNQIIREKGLLVVAPEGGGCRG